MCDELEPALPTCIKTMRSSGYLRFAWVAGWPFALAVLLIIAPLSYLRRRDQRLCKGCSVHAGADRRTLCHTRVGTDGSAVGCPNAAQAASYPAGGYK